MVILKNREVYTVCIPRPKKTTNKKGGYSASDSNSFELIKEKTNVAYTRFWQGNSNGPDLR